MKRKEFYEMRTCCACGYKAKVGEKTTISFHSFPKEEEQRQQWKDAIGKENFSPTPSTFLCSQHFEEKHTYFTGGFGKRRRLHPGAVPTIFQKWDNLRLPKAQTEQSMQISTAAIVDETIQIPSDKSAEQNDPEPTTSTINNITDKPANRNNPKRTTSKINNIRKILRTHCKKRQFNPRYISDISIKDMMSPHKAVRYWKLAVTCVQQQRIKINTLNKKVSRLQRKIQFLEEILKKTQRIYRPVQRKLYYPNLCNTEIK